MPYEFIEETPESNFATFGKESLRHGARTASNIATRAVGLPGDILSLVNEYIARPISEKITGEESVPYEETFLGKTIPTTETHRKGLEEVSGEYLRPRNKVEKFLDNVIEDTTLLFNPTQIARKGLMKGAKPFRNFAKSLGANFLGETTKQISQSETAGDLTKLGSLFFLSVLDQPNAIKQIGKLYHTAESHLPEASFSNASSLDKNLSNLEHTVTKGRPLENLSPSEKFVINQTGKVRNLIQNGEINIPQAISQKRSLNEELAALYKEVPAFKEQKRARNLAKQINGFLNETIREYGKKNPAFYKPYKEADQAFGTFSRSHFIGNWIEKNISHSPITTGLIHLFSPIGTLAAGAIVPYQGIKLGYRVIKSPTLARIYANALKSAAKEDKANFNKYLKELDEGLQKEEQEDQYEFID